MNDYKMLNLIRQVGIQVVEVKPRVYKGYSCNIKQWRTFRIWLNKSNKITIRKMNVQRSFDVQNRHQLAEVFRGFEII